MGQIEWNADEFDGSAKSVTTMAGALTFAIDSSTPNTNVHAVTEFDKQMTDFENQVKSVRSLINEDFANFLQMAAKMKDADRNLAAMLGKG